MVSGRVSPETTRHGGGAVPSLALPRKSLAATARGSGRLLLSATSPACDIGGGEQQRHLVSGVTSLGVEGSPLSDAVITGDSSAPLLTMDRSS